MREVHVSFTHTKSLLYGPLSSSLVCAVSYTTQYGEKLYFRKFFKFQVSYIEESSLEVECRLGKDLRNVADQQAPSLLGGASPSSTLVCVAPFLFSSVTRVRR